MNLNNTIIIAKNRTEFYELIKWMGINHPEVKWCTGNENTEDYKLEPPPLKEKSEYLLWIYKSYRKEPEMLYRPQYGYNEDGEYCGYGEWENIDQCIAMEYDCEVPRTLRAEYIMDENIALNKEDLISFLGGK